MPPKNVKDVKDVRTGNRLAKPMDSPTPPLLGVGTPLGPYVGGGGGGAVGSYNNPDPLLVIRPDGVPSTATPAPIVHESDDDLHEGTEPDSPSLLTHITPDPGDEIELLREEEEEEEDEEEEDEDEDEEGQEDKKDEDKDKREDKDEDKGNVGEVLSPFDLANEMISVSNGPKSVIARNLK